MGKILATPSVGVKAKHMSADISARILPVAKKLTLGLIPDSSKYWMSSMFSFSMAMTHPDLPSGSTQSMSKMLFFLPKAVTIRLTAARSPRSMWSKKSWR